MNEEENNSSPISDRVIERGETYNHTEHGRVEVTGIWQETQWVDSVCKRGEKKMVAIRFLPPEGDDWNDELSERLSEFRDAID